ncbi:MAG: non-homologous end-joining DNA ligase [Actinomycetota bacterium]|nr:non-homologous end-joining DNA ligase [Actinomycetota bacterium]
MRGHDQRASAERATTVTNPDKTMYPETGFTKKDLVSYYRDISPAMLPHLFRRPLTLKRYPDGVTGQSFYEKNCPSHRPAWVEVARVPSQRRGTTEFCVANDQATLVWLANLAAIELHPVLSRAPLGEPGATDGPPEPTMVVFDLDPGAPAGATDCAQVALLLREVLAVGRLQCWTKTSGKKGLQVYVPLNTTHSFEQTKQFARSIASLLAERHPQQVVDNMSLSLRPDRVLIDWSQNDASKTTVAAYSLRAMPEPTVSTPLTWVEVEQIAAREGPSPSAFAPGTVLERVRDHGDLFAPVEQLRQALPSPLDRRLQDYVSKRSFSVTPEPAPSIPEPDAQGQSPRLAGGRSRQSRRTDDASEPGAASERGMPASFEPMKATLAEVVPTDASEWAFEVKWDGFRTVALTRDGSARLQSRTLSDTTGSFPTVAAIGSAVGRHDLILDGEICALDSDGRPDFSLLQQRSRQPTDIVYMLFDVVYLDGRWLTGMPYSERRSILEALELRPGPWQVPAYHVGDGQALLAATRLQGLEGLVAKRLDSVYQPGKRSRAWLKLKNRHSQELVVAGWIPGRGRRSGGVGSLLLGYYDRGDLRYAGKVGTGFTQAELDRLAPMLESRRLSSSPFWPGTALPPDVARQARFARPDLVAQVEFAEWTVDGILRAPSYRGLRLDKPAGVVVRERPL